MGDSSLSNPAQIVGLIPARLASTRLPDKPLIDIMGKPMLQHVWERARAVHSFTDVAIATPDAKIRDCAEAFGATVVMTSSSHRSGTDRIAEAANVMGLDGRAIILNIQGDEPLLEPDGIEALIAMMRADPTVPMASLMCPCPESEWNNPSCVKVVTAQNGQALYFSRARIPFPRNPNGPAVMQHIGLYGYRRSFLETYATLGATPLETEESLEQLRVLEHGFRIRMARVEAAPIGVDTPEDLENVRRILTDRMAGQVG